MRIKYMAAILLVGCGLYFWYVTSIPPTLAQQREYFAAAEKLLADDKKKDFQHLAKKLGNYPLYPYLQYQWLKNRLSQTEVITDFITAYKNDHYAELLRQRWLLQLADAKNWPVFVKYYQAGDDKNLTCLYYWGQYQIGERAKAFKSAQALWSAMETVPETCTPLYDALTASRTLTTDALWQRFSAALKQNNVAAANAVSKLFGAENQPIAKKWLQVHHTPDIIQNPGFWQAKNGLMGQIFAHGIDRLAKTNLKSAVASWDAQKQAFTMDTETSQRIEHRLALSLAMRRDPGAFGRMQYVIQPDAELRAWVMRSVLFAQNWPQVIAAFKILSAEEQQDPHWQYWYARALAETGENDRALAAYTIVARDRSFYGFLAADLLNQPYQFNDKPIVVNEDTFIPLRQNTELAAIEEFRAINRETEARRLWFSFITKLNKQEMAMAAKLAQRWHWDQIAIITATKAEYWDDLDLRFPNDYREQIESNAALYELDPAIIFGLIRQESMMDKMASSKVGAKGLMQLMPATGQQIAAALNETWNSENDLYKPDVNIRYGSYYFKQLLNQFNGQFALATAAYNAGPGRVKKWLPKGQALPVDLWVEYIPYKETRKYVTSVLSYAIIYQYRLQRHNLKLKSLLPDIPAIKN